MLARIEDLPPPLRLYGRSKLLNVVRDRLLHQPSKLLILRGKSGVGKSAFLRGLRNGISDAAPDSLICDHRIESQAFSVQHLLAALTTPILEKGLASEGGLDKFRRALNLISRDNVVALATAGLIDLTSKLAPELKKTAESLLSVLSSTANLASGKAAAERIIKTGNDDILAAFIGLIQAVSAEGFCGVILLDQVELASQAVLDAAIAVVRKLPDNWAFCATVNDELPEGQIALQIIRPPLLYRGGQILTVPGLDLTALEVWTQDVRGGVPSMAELGGVLEGCDGRPLFLQDWVRGLTNTPEVAVHNRLDAYYEERLRRLSPDSRRLLRMLSVLPAYTYFSFDFCHALLATDNPSRSVDSTIDVITELQDKYFLESQSGVDDTYRLIHEVTREHIFRRLPRSAVRKSAETILSVIDTHLRDSGSAAQLSYLILADLADRSDLIYRDALRIASTLLGSGAYESARAAYSLCVKSAPLQVASTQDEFKAKALLGLSTILVHTGFYEDALQNLASVSNAAPSQSVQARASLLKAESCLRLNRYELALTELEVARSRFVSLADLSGEIEAERVHNTVLRDRGLHVEATLQAQHLVQRARTGQVEPLTLAGCLRSLSRSLALTHQIDDALAASQEALEIASAVGSIRARGNAQLAFGEAHRHGLNLEEAASRYNLAIHDAESISNRDSLLWATLGLADTLVLQNKAEDARRILTELGDVVAGASERYPLEHLHWLLSVRTVDFLLGACTPGELRSVTTGYRSLGIQWPEEYVEVVLAGSSPLPTKRM